MANGTASDEFVVLSNVRPGLKRELAFVLKAQSEICGGALGRTRSRKAQSDSPSAQVSPSCRNKRLKKSSVGSRDDKGDAGSVGHDSREAAEMDNMASGDLEDRKGDVLVEVMAGAGALMSEEEAESDVVDLENRPEKNFAEPLNEKVVINANIGGATTSQPCEERSTMAAGTVSVGNDEVLEKESDSRKIPINGNNETLLSQGFHRRFTRSLLKPKDEEAADTVPKRKAKSAVSDAAVNADVDMLSNVASTSAVMPNNMEMKMSKKIGLRQPFVALKDFLDTGLLEGYPVKYCRGLRGLQQGRKGLGGVIKGNGIQCSCNQCKGLQVVSPTIFELHAGSSNKRPPEYIILENGRTLRDVMNAVKDSPLETLEEAVQGIIGTPSINKCLVCINCKGPLIEVGVKSSLLCNICLELRESYSSPCQVPDAIHLTKEVLDTRDQIKGADTAGQSTKVPESTDQVMELCDANKRSPESCLMKKSSASATRPTASQVKSHGRLTRKDLRLHKLVFEEDVLPDGTEVAYYTQGKKMLVGYKKGHGILCTCCGSEVSASTFEAHAGFASRRKPYLNIYTSNGVSLHELSITLAKSRRLSTFENDDLCSICFDGGDLLCCDTCPRAFHLECIHLSSLPTGGWNCRYCENMFQKESFVERNANALAAGRVAGADVIQQITNRCIRIVNTPDTDVGGCALCRGHGFAKSGFGPRTVIICDQCEKEFHVGCLRDHKMANLKHLPEGKWFCCTDCQQIHSALESYVAQRGEKLPDSLMCVIRTKLEEKGSVKLGDLDISWRVLNGKMDSSDESRRLLSKSVSIFHERFDPITESASGRDLIPAMVYGKSYKDQEFSGMFCIILVVNQEIVSAGLLRIFGEEVAELPLVATSSDCQGQGYFQSLFVCIERLLTSFRVKKLVLPAAEEAESIWTKKFGFAKIAPEELREIRRKYHMMIFHGTTVLQKSVPGLTNSEPEMMAG